MIIHAEIKERHYYHVTVEYLKASGIEQSLIDKALCEDKWNEVIRKRGQLLFETDWTQGKDSPLTSENTAAFASYRQKLRDIPQAYIDPTMVKWPEKPKL